MIESLEITNFQSHSYSIFDFDRGINIIKGQSRSGKSSTIRALKWALFNRPRGVGFKSHFADEDVEVSLSFIENSWITRSRNGINLYYSDNLELKALRTDVPDEIKDITLIEDINFQSQGDPYFLIGETPGVAGKKLNEFVGLTIIDDCRKDINRLANKVGVNLNIVEEDIETTTSRLKEDFKHLKKAELSVKLIDKAYDKLRSKDKELDDLDILIRAIKLKQKNIKSYKKWLKVKKDFDHLKKQYDKSLDLRFTHDSIENLCRTIRNIQKDRKTTTIWLKDAKKRRSELIKQLDFCQTCGAERKYWKNDQTINNR